MKVKRIAIVTGATGGLGREFVRLLLKEKNIDEIWALARNEKKLGRLKEKFGKKVKIYSFDLSSVRQIQCFEDRKSTRLNSSHANESRMPSSA